MMINGSPYLANGTPQRCALCNASFMLRTSTSSAGREKTIGTTAVPSTLISAWIKSLQRLSLWGGKCHEAL
jgi:hypothetical protein